MTTVESYVISNNKLKNWKHEICNFWFVPKLCIPICCLYSLPCALGKIAGKTNIYCFGTSYKKNYIFLLIMYMIFQSFFIIDTLLVYRYIKLSPEYQWVYPFIYYGWWVLFFIFGGIIYKLRIGIRNKYNIAGDSGTDMLMSFCCQEITTIHLAREVDIEQPCGCSKPDEYEPMLEPHEVDQWITATNVAATNVRVIEVT